MTYEDLASRFVLDHGMEHSTMMGSPCLRYRGEFVAMMFDKEDALILKLSAPRVDELIEEGLGREFNYTGKRFKQWILIPTEMEESFEPLMLEAVEFAKQKKR